MMTSEPSRYGKPGGESPTVGFEEGLLMEAFDDVIPLQLVKEGYWMTIDIDLDGVGGERDLATPLLLLVVFHVVDADIYFRSLWDIAPYGWA